jgi:hypothetical protein
MQHAGIYTRNWVDKDAKCRHINKLAVILIQNGGKN